jgi:hypothetical protein
LNRLLPAGVASRAAISPSLRGACHCRRCVWSGRPRRGPRPAASGAPVL